VRIEWKEEDLAQPARLGREVLLDLDLSVLRRYVDWTFFFTAWEIKGRYPAVLDHPRYGEAARDLFENANRLLDEIVAGKLLRAAAVFGVWPASGEGEDVRFYDPEGGGREVAQFHFLRQQHAGERGQPNLCLADFVAPRSTGLRDHAGAFAVTGGLGAEELARRFEAEHDDYRAIMVKALADRLAEAAAEWLHQRVRETWGIEPRPLPLEDLLRERFRGIRPALGYAACPDHTEKRTLFRLLRAEEVGMGLTESCAMTPAASVSGLYLAHPKARYFAVGRIGEEQARRYAERKGVPLPEVERSLSSILGYEPRLVAGPA
jgi:5-methyltetrahydrofolate--homocysteine methyltransferase